MPQDSERGATLVEFAVVMPLLLLLLFGVIEFGRAVATYTSVVTAAREAARYGTTVGDSPTSPGTPRYLDCDGIRDAARDKSPLVDLADEDITITYDNGPGSSEDADCQGVTPPTDILVVPGDRIVVTVDTSFTTSAPFVSNFIGSLNISSTQARSVFKGVISG